MGKSSERREVLRSIEGETPNVASHPNRLRMLNLVYPKLVLVTYCRNLLVLNLEHGVCRCIVFF
jgi:hypothetical protein